MKLEIKYDNLTRELISITDQIKEAKRIFDKAQFELNWYLSVLIKTVDNESIDDFKKATGYQTHDVVIKENSVKNNNIKLEEADLSSDVIVQNNIAKPKWAKEVYKRAVRRCHPDRLINVDSDYREELVDIYQHIVTAYDSLHYPNLMIECSKLFIKPKNINKEKVNMLEKFKVKTNTDLKNIINSDAYA